MIRRELIVADGSVSQSCGRRSFESSIGERHVWIANAECFRLRECLFSRFGIREEFIVGHQMPDSLRAFTFDSEHAQAGPTRFQVEKSNRRPEQMREPLMLMLRKERLNRKGLDETDSCSNLVSSRRSLTSSSAPSIKVGLLFRTNHRRDSPLQILNLLPRIAKLHERV